MAESPTSITGYWIGDVEGGTSLSMRIIEGENGQLSGTAMMAGVFHGTINGLFHNPTVAMDLTLEGWGKAPIQGRLTNPDLIEGTVRIIDLKKLKLTRQS